MAGPGGSSSIAERPFSTLSGCLYTAHGAYMIIGGLFLAVFSWLIPLLLHKVVYSDVIDPDEVPAAARWLVDHRGLAPLMALPVIVFGLIIVNRVPGRTLWVVLGLLSMLLPGLLLIYTFIMTIGLLYKPHPL